MISTLDEYPTIDKLLVNDQSLIRKVYESLSTVGFFYLKDESSMRKNIDTIFSSLAPSQNVFYGKPAGMNNADDFQATYTRYAGSESQLISVYQDLIEQLLPIISTGFGYAPPYLTTYSKQHDCGLYFYDQEDHYNEFLKSVGNNDIVTSEHCDLSMITIVVSICGLEAYEKNIGWFSLPDKPGYLLIQGGTMLEQATSGKIIANRHRVRGHDSSKAVFWGTLPSLPLS